MEYGRLNLMHGSPREAVTAETLAAIRQLVSEQDIVADTLAPAKHPVRSRRIERASAIKRCGTQQVVSDMPAQEMPTTGHDVTRTEPVTETDSLPLRDMCRAAVMDAMEDGESPAFIDRWKAQKTVFERLFGK